MKTDAQPVGRLLLSHSTRVYESLHFGKELDRTHVSAWQNFAVARTFLDLGFDVDVIHFEDSRIVPDQNYDVMVDVVSNIGRLSDAIGRNTKKFLLPMFAHWTVHNSRSYARHAALAQRRGASIAPLRLVTPNDSVEKADRIFCKGGDFSYGTYDYAGTPISRISQTHPAAIDTFIKRDVRKCRNNFMWIGGSSAVHKGLDLLLDAFVDLPDCRLAVVGNVPSEKRFTSVYERELFDTENVDTVGWVDTLSPTFRDLSSNVIAVIVPSASETACGSVIAGMMSGLIPIVTDSTDVDVQGFGIRISEGSVDGVMNAIRELSSKSDSELADMSRCSWETAWERYGRKKFLDSFHSAVCDALGIAPAPIWQQDDLHDRIPEVALR